MKLIAIDWTFGTIEEIETDSIKYEEDGISYTVKNDSCTTKKKLPYKNFLGIEGLH